MKLSSILGLGAAAFTSATVAQAQTVDPAPAPVALGGIFNEATVTGFYGTTSVDAKDDERVDVAAGAPDLSIVKTASAATIALGAKTDRADALDTITYTYVVKNEGNVTLTGVTPVDTGPTFGLPADRQAAVNSLSAFVVTATGAATATLKPDESATFTAVYTLADLDVYHAADTTALAADEKALVVNTATSSGVTPQDEVYADADESTAKVEIFSKPEIGLVKLATLDDTNDNGFADLNEIITYTYTVTNLGNVPLTEITVADIHEEVGLASGEITSEVLVATSPALLAATTGAVSSDAEAVDGVWSLLQPEDSVVFTYLHTVTQAEVDGG